MLPPVNTEGNYSRNVSKAVMCCSQSNLVFEAQNREFVTATLQLRPVVVPCSSLS